MMRGRTLVNRLATLLVVLVAIVCAARPLAAEDGYDLWLRYAPLEGEALQRLRDFSPKIRVIGGEQMVVATGDGFHFSPQQQAATAELHRGLASLMGAAKLEPGNGKNFVTLDCGIHNPVDVAQFYSIESSDEGIRISGRYDIDCLYGAFALLRALELGADPASISMRSSPAMPLRMLNHWDNPDGHVERGYAGRSIFDWWHLPERLDERMIDYARANASIGINGVVVNNVNARAFMLEPRFIAKYKRLADAWRPYGIRLYISVRFSAPIEIGGLDTADPIDPQVRAWWKTKADEIYASIPDFGGFLVKANSEGQPGPQDYGRSHSEGANMMAEALGDRGTVIWRAFVYSAEDTTDRARQAFAEFAPLDGQFADNVIVQVKNGPVDFQPREPFHPLFGAMPETKLMLEAQVTKEYLGFASHLAFLAPMWRETLQAGTGRAGSVAEVVAPAGMAGVANTGSDRNWTGSHFDQANWYALGRLAWDPSLSSEEIAREWVIQTFARDTADVAAITSMMVESREAVVGYMTPLGLAHLMDTGHHYGPAPWVCHLPRPEWNPCYYHRADAQGIGFDRTSSGSDALTDYDDEIAAEWAEVQSIENRYLLWFHHVNWDYRLASGHTVWEELVAEYDAGVRQVDLMAETWAKLSGTIDPQRHRAVTENLAIQQREARWWRNASIAYWQSINNLPMPEGRAAPPETIEAYRNRNFPEAPGQ